MIILQARFVHKAADVARIAKTSLAGAAALLLSLGTACSSDHSITTSNLIALTPAALVAFSGSGQSATVGTAVAQSLIVRATTASGTPVSGVTITFGVTSGSATLSPSAAVTDSTGEARTTVTAGTTAGTVVVNAVAESGALSASFTITVTAITATATCTPTSLAVGGAMIVSGSTVCVTGGTSPSEYALIPFNGSTTASNVASVAVAASGITAVSTTLASSVLTGDASSGALTAGGALASVNGRRTFELGLRSREHEAMSARLASARAWHTTSRNGNGARLKVVPATATVGSIYSLNANSDDACVNPSYRAGRVMAVGRKALIVADTLNPSGGFTADEYAAIASTFDDVVDAVDTKNFGQPTDIDGNGHVVLFFTSAVNALTPRNADYYIGGFFYGRDLLPTTGSTSFSSCAGSNTAEMFYLLVPDPIGAINGNSFTKTFVSTNTIATTAHEYQHLINASRRMYVNTAATDFEETWLDEGLAHVAEELVFYARSGLTPLSNLDAPTIKGNTTYRTAFNEDGISNFGRFWSFLENPTANSPYADNDSLATRGATWSLLRYTVDQQSPSQPTLQYTLWYSLVNSTTTGLANMRQVFGDMTPIVRDWATSALLDDVTGASSRYQFLSWNMRSIFGALNSGTYPLATRSLTNGGSTSVSLVAGGAAYLRFGVVAGGRGALNWTTSSSNVQTTLVRLK